MSFCLRLLNLGIGMSSFTFAYANEENFICSGTEPFWGFQYIDGEATYDVMMGERQPLLRPKLETFYGMSMGAGFYVRGETKDKKKLTASVVKAKECSDGMSDTIYSSYITLDYNGEHMYYGCCRSLTKKNAQRPIPAIQSDKIKEPLPPSKPLLKKPLQEMRQEGSVRRQENR